MILARCDGTIVSTACHPSMRGWRTIICQPLDPETGADAGQLILATDPHGAGLHQRIIVTTDGPSTQRLVGDRKSPLRNMVAGLLDD